MALDQPWLLPAKGLQLNRGQRTCGIASLPSALIFDNPMDACGSPPLGNRLLFFGVREDAHLSSRANLPPPTPVSRDFRNR